MKSSIKKIYLISNSRLHPQFSRLRSWLGSGQVRGTKAHDCHELRLHAAKIRIPPILSDIIQTQWLFLFNSSLIVFHFFIYYTSKYLFVKL